MEGFTSDTQIHANPIRTIFYVLALILFLNSFAQGELSSSNKKSVKLYYKADKKYKERDFESAISYLEEATSLDTTFFEAYIRLGSLYNAMGQLDSVYSKFDSYINTAHDPIASVLEKMASMAFDRGEYAKSNSFLKRFLAKVPEKANDNEIRLLVASIQFAADQLNNPQVIEINELPDAINRYRIQYLPAITVDNLTMIYTKRDVFSSDEDIVISYKKDGVWQPSQSVSPKINTPLNEGACTISADGRTMIFTSCDRRDAYGSCDLYLSRRIGDYWTRPRNMGKVVNSKYWESQPSLSADGKTLYFASNRPGGFGGRDIWATQIVDGVWQRPKNLGKEVNSFKDETTPFIHFNGESLYFSSNSYPGMGGFDLYVSAKLDTTWSQPQNMGYPINTFRDEVSLLINATGDFGYFAKEKQKNSEILDSKIVEVKIPDNIRPPESAYLVGKVIDAVDKKPLMATIEVVDIESNKQLYNNDSDSLSGAYYMVLPSNRKLAGYVKKPGYLYHDFSFSTSIKSDSLVIELSPIAVGQSLVLKNIYFETDSFELDERSQSELSNVVQLLNENPELEIEIRGHTDNTGLKSYNQSLSEKRALSVYNAIIKMGVSRNRLFHRGLGDTLPIASNDSEKDRQSNRRIEFRVLRLSR